MLGTFMRLNQAQTRKDSVTWRSKVPQAIASNQKQMVRTQQQCVTTVIIPHCQLFRGCWAALREDWFHLFERRHRSLPGYAAAAAAQPLWTGFQWKITVLAFNLPSLFTQVEEEKKASSKRGAKTAALESGSLVVPPVQVTALLLTFRWGALAPHPPQLYLHFSCLVSGTLHWDSRSVRSIEYPWYEHQPDRKWIPVAKLCQSQLSGLRLILSLYLICDPVICCS